MKYGIVGCALVFVFAAPMLAEAQIGLDPPHAGDCSLVIRVPANTDPMTVSIALNSAAAPVTFTVLQSAPIVAGLKQPLALNDEVIVTVGAMGATARVAVRE